MKKLTKLSIILVIASVLVSNLYATSQTKVWQKIYTGNNYSGAYAITPTKDGGFIVAGCTEALDNGESRVYLIKIDESGNTFWERTFGGEKDDVAYAIAPAKGGNFIVAGYTKSFGNGKSDVYLLKIDEDGNKIWEETFGEEKDDIAYAIIRTEDKKFIISGYTESFGNGKKDIYLIKVKYNQK